MQAKPCVAIRADRLLPCLIQSLLQSGGGPATPLQGPDLLRGVIRGPAFEIQSRHLSGQQHHLPAVMHPGTQASEPLRHLEGTEPVGVPMEPLGGHRGTPPVFRHPIDDHTVEVEDEERTCRHD